MKTEGTKMRLKLSQDLDYVSIYFEKERKSSQETE